MKWNLYLIATTALALASCQQHSVPVKPRPEQQARVALPGQAASTGARTETDEAFERQAAAYAQEAAGLPSMGAEIPPPVAPTEAVSTSSDSQEQGSVALPPAKGDMNYTIKVANATRGSLFIEAQDDSGTIYPCGFMPPQKSYSTPMTQAAPVNGHITVVVRDPDKDGAPEIRRYKVSPPPSYANGTIGIKILPGGNYTASLNGTPYYATPGAAEAEAALARPQETPAAASGRNAITSPNSMPSRL